MIRFIIAQSLKHKAVVFLVYALLIFASIWAIRSTSLDVLPDLSPAQVIVQISYKGQSAALVEEQATYEVVSRLLSVSGIDTVRGFSSFENALVYAIFDDNTDLYWARSRIQEELGNLQNSLPKGVEVSLGSDASGVGWIYQYALTSNTLSLEQLRTLNDYTIRNALLGIDGVSDAVSVGGFVPNYEIRIDNNRLIEHNLAIEDVISALKNNNNDTGGRIVLENGYEWMVQALGRTNSLEAIRNTLINRQNGIPLCIKDIAHVQKVPANRRGVAELNGKGEVVGGIVMMRYGGDAYRIIQNIKKKLETFENKEVHITPTYDRSTLIDKAIATLKNTLIEESVIVLVVVGIFLLHFRSALVVIIVLPIVVLLTFLMMKLAGIGSNIMSLGGIAIAIGAMVDATIVMIENSHKKLHAATKDLNRPLNTKEHATHIYHALIEVGPAIFFSLLVVIISFLPLFFLSGQEGKLFTPLAFTKTFAMLGGALVGITLVPALIALLVKGRIIDESKHAIYRLFNALYHPILVLSLRFKYGVLAVVALLVLATIPIYNTLKWEFMPMLDEQSVMYMPVTPYGINVALSKEILQKTDAILKDIPEVLTVFGKAGRANTATDPAPLAMIETIITFKDKSQWRKGLTKKMLMQELEQKLQVPGLINSWTYPIRGRIDMLLSGIRTPLGIKLYGDDPKVLQQIAQNMQHKLNTLDSTQSAFADQANVGYYIDIKPKNSALYEYGITKEQLLQAVRYSIGGARVGEVLQGNARFDITVRLNEAQRSNVESIKNIRIKTPKGFVPLHALSHVERTMQSSVIKTEKAKRVSYVYITPKDDVPLSTYTQQAKEVLQDIKLPLGYYYEFAGQSKYLNDALQAFTYIVPLVLVFILLFIFLALKELVPTLIVFGLLPLALIGGIWYIDYLNYSLSIAVVVGFLALLGIATQTAIVMILFIQEHVNAQKQLNSATLHDAIIQGATSRLRPKLMTVFAITAGLLPIMYINSVGSEIMQRIAAPMIGGMISSAVLSLIVIPVLYYTIMVRRV